VLSGCSLTGWKPCSIKSCRQCSRNIASSMSAWQISGCSASIIKTTTRS
jgi:hypothetical protein